MRCGSRGAHDGDLRYRRSAEPGDSRRLGDDPDIPYRVVRLGASYRTLFLFPDGARKFRAQILEFVRNQRRSRRFKRDTSVAESSYEKPTERPIVARASRDSSAFAVESEAAASKRPSSRSFADALPY